MTRQQNMKAQFHVVVAGAFAGGLYAATGSWPATLTCFVSGVLIDVDHLLDYTLEHYESFGIRHFFATWDSGSLRRAYLVFHSWELFIALALATALMGWNLFVLGLAVGVGHHLVFDQIAYRPHPLAYSFFWRWWNGFGLKESFRRRG